MATLNLSGVRLPYDPIIDVIGSDVKKNPVFQRVVSKMRHTVVAYRNTLHPSDELLEAWYRFKENQICQQ